MFLWRNKKNIYQIPPLIYSLAHTSDYLSIGNRVYDLTRAVVGQRSSPAGYILYCNIFIIKPYNIGHTDLAVFVCKSFCHIDIIIQVRQFSMK